eukprot:NODE_6026_length_886_cov_111.808650_g5797_i0.p1 GENE.NODE_6026_length_886_cov_111.808650_g5797_i0~~NODE_6026_length_886_cov_111.808650_g5797_i0.p1  ORF type:complete len:184 (+),score=53.50 NODE_6026_length_886_cov_111.808650_g5797_i0:60-554(+)
MPKSILEKIQEGERLKEEANQLLKEGNLKKASFTYKQALMFVNDLSGGAKNSDPNDQSMAMMQAFAGKNAPKATVDEEAAAKAVALSLYLNLAHVDIKRELWHNAIEHAEKALSLDPGNIKGLYRRGKGHFGRGDIDRAKEDWERVREQDPSLSQAVFRYPAAE